ncbi:MAG: hypothetical protein NTW95_08135 [Candidatus Aminicenantes bacterium]|nr:hypothetical protein [Candidatus Aminicenantes bacterium]
MIKKEWLEVSKQSLYFVMAAAGMVLLTALLNWLQGKPQFQVETVIIILGFWLLMFSLFLGLSPFALDSNQQGMEYLLTLPFSRRRLLVIKLLPRLSAAVLFYAVFFLLYRLSGGDAFGGYFEFFSLVYFSLFFISFSLSNIHENFIVQFIWAGLALSGYLTLCSLILTQGFAWNNNFSLGSFWKFGHFGHLIYDSSSLIAAIVVFLLLLAPFMASYFLTFKKFDLRPARNFNRRQLLFFVPLLLLATVFSLGVSYQLQKNSIFGHLNLFLMENGQLLKASWPGNLTVYDGNGSKKITTGKALYWDRVLLEKGQQLFLLGYDTEDGSYIIIRLDMKDFSWKTLHRVPDRYLASNNFYSFNYDGVSFVNLQRSQTEADRPGMDSRLPLKSDELELVRVDPFSGQSRTITYRSPIFKNYYDPRFFGCDKINGLRFWLISSPNWGTIIRLWEDGRIEDLGLTKGFPAYCSGLLFSQGSSSLQVRRLLAKGSETVKEIDGEFSLILSFNHFFQVKKDIGEIYTDRGKGQRKRIVRLDLATLAVDDVGPDSGFMRFVAPGDFYFVEYRSWPVISSKPVEKWRKVYRLKDGQMIFLKQFDSRGSGRIYGGYVEVQEHGIIFYDQDMPRVFAFPDLRELKFNKLN